MGIGLNRRVLVVDDEPLVARVMKAMLQSVGDVETSDTVDGAIVRIESGAVDIILCDLSLPGENGEDLHRWLARHRPELLQRLGFTTGGATTPGAHEFLKEVRPPTLLKPFTRQELLEFARKLLSDR